MEKKNRVANRISDPELTIVYPVCAGIDVHRDKLDVTVGVNEESGKVRYHHKVWATAFESDLFEIAEWLGSFGCKHVCLEATGKLWIPVASILEKSCEICLTNAYHVKAIPGKKTDKMDSKRLCHLYKYGYLKGSYVQSEELMQIKFDLRDRRKLVDMKRSVTQRLIDTLNVSGVRLSSVFSQVLCASSVRLINYMLDNPGKIPEDVGSYIHGSCKKSPEEIKRALGSGFNEYEVIVIREKLSLIEEFDERISTIEKRVDEKMKQLENVERIKELLDTLPRGFGEHFTRTFIAEIGTDLSPFETVDNFTSWLGLAPGKNESAGKQKKSKIRPSQKYFKPVIVECVHAMVKTKEDSYFKYRFWQIAGRKGKKTAAIAIARMIMHCIYYMIKNDEPFDQLRYDMYLRRAWKDYNNVNLNIKEPPLRLTEQQAIAIAQGYGYELTKKAITP